MEFLAFRIGDKGHFVEPTVFADVTDNMKIAVDEVYEQFSEDLIV